MGPGWRWAIGVEHLLGHVKGVVGVDGGRAGCCFLWWWWRREVTRRREELANSFGFIDDLSVKGSFFGHLKQMEFSLLDTSIVSK